jgi:SagB-type dehydrogenase family enzyme
MLLEEQEAGLRMQENGRLDGVEVDVVGILHHRSQPLLLPLERRREAPDLEGAPPPDLAQAEAAGPRSFALRPLQEPPALSVEATIRTRGSSRRFARRAIRAEQLSTMLVAATGSRPAGALSDIYVIVNAVDQLPSGAYVYHPGRQELELLRGGEFRREATYLDLGQELSGDASVNFYMLADLEPIFAQYGNRGYRAAQLDGAIIGGRLYLAAYALGLGATGLTFFDDDVTEFFSPHAQGKGVMFLVAAGVRATDRS